MISVAYTNKPFLDLPNIKFPKIAAGEYVVKVYRQIFNFTSRYIGIEPVTVTEDTRLNIYCTWPKSITITARDQNGNNIKNIQLLLYKNDTIISSNVTELSSDTVFNVPFNLIDPYILKYIYQNPYLQEISQPVPPSLS